MITVNITYKHFANFLKILLNESAKFIRFSGKKNVDSQIKGNKEMFQMSSIVYKEVSSGYIISFANISFKTTPVPITKIKRPGYRKCDFQKFCPKITQIQEICEIGKI